MNSLAVTGSFWFFLIILTLAPLPYGSAHLWSFSLLSILTGIAMLLWTVAAALRADLYPVHASRYAIPAILFAVVLIWLFIQGSPYTPEGLHHPIWADVRAALPDQAVRGAISLNPDGTPDILARMGAYAVVFWLAMQFGRSPERANLIYWAIAITGTLYAVYGIWAYVSGSGMILFSEKWAYQLSLTSTFVNRNHYAVFAGMGLITSFGLTIKFLKRDASGAFDSSRRFLNSMENLKLPVFFLIVICLAMACALLLTKSRGGVAFTAVGLVGLIMMLQAGGSLRKRTSLALFGVLTLLGIASFIIGGGGLADRIAAQVVHSDRHLIHGVALDAIADAPLLGHGAGSFPALFHMYRGADFATISPAFASAHSVYLEFAAEAGLVAAGLYFGLLLLIVIRCFAGTLQRRRNEIYPAIGVATALLVGFHSYFDFGPQVPGVSVTFAAILGVAFAQSWPTEGRRGSRQSNEKQSDRN